MAGNIAPVAILIASKEKLTWPEKKVTLSLKNSYDPNKRGVIEGYAFFQVSGHTVAFTSSAEEVTDVDFPEPGTYQLGGRVTDRGGLSGEAFVTIIVEWTPVSKTTFGASGPTIETPDTLEFICGYPSVTRSMTVLDTYKGNGNKEVDKYLATDQPIFYNLNLSAVKKDSQGNKIPNPFCKDMTFYKSKLEPVLKFYQNHPKKNLIMCVIENEPTTAQFHSGPMSDYLKLLQFASKLCRQYGYIVCDGAVHVQTVNGADAGGEGKASQVAELLAGYADIDLDYVLMHTSNIGADYPADAMRHAVEKVFNITGHKSSCNEWHVKNGTAQLISKMVFEFAKSGMAHSVYISGAGEGDDLNNGMILTPIGQAYKSASIK